MPLSDARLRTFKAVERPTKLSDGGGLHVLVTPRGAKLWRLAYRFVGGQKLLEPGPCPGCRRYRRQTRLSDPIEFVEVAMRGCTASPT